MEEQGSGGAGELRSRGVEQGSGVAGQWSSRGGE